MKKYLVMFCLITILIFAAGQGCTKQEGETIQSPYVGGTQGAVSGFEVLGILEENIETIWENEKFPLQVSVKNKGEENIAQGDLQVALKGILIDDFEGVDITDGKHDGIMANSEEIDGLSAYNPDGGEETINFGDLVYKVPITGSFYDIGFFAETTYRYKTQVAVPKVCFNGKPSDTSICSVDEKKTIFSSGAPIQVKQVEEKPAGKGMIALEFQVEDVGGGDVALPGTELGQNFNPRYDEVAYVLTPETERDKWECTSGGRTNEARLVDDKAVIRCKLKTENKLSEDTIYTKQIGLEVSYDYRSLISKQLRIKRET